MQEMSTDFLIHLTSCNRLSDVAAERVRRVQLETADRLAPVLLKLGLLSEADLAAEMVAFSGHPFAGSSASLQRLDATDLAVTDAFLRAHQLVPIARDEAGLTIACWDALDEYAARALTFACEAPLRWVIATQSQIRQAFEVQHQGVGESRDAAPGSSAVEDEEIERLKDLASEAPVIRLVQRVIDDAVRQKASDIHLEAAENAFHIRFRMDGLLREMATHSKELSASTISGESVVLRILDRQGIALDFDALDSTPVSRA